MRGCSQVVVIWLYNVVYACDTQGLEARRVPRVRRWKAHEGRAEAKRGISDCGIRKKHYVCTYGTACIICRALPCKPPMRQVRDGEAVQGVSGIWAAADSPAVRVDGAGRHPPSGFSSIPYSPEMVCIGMCVQSLAELHAISFIGTINEHI